ncbi:MAG: SDR family oxidoreductase [Desulfomonilaceae bacterium]
MEIVRGRVALIAGAGDAISESVAIRLAKGGAKVAVAGTDSDSVSSLVSRITGLGAASSAVILEANKKDKIDNMVTEVHKRFGRIDILVNCFNDTNGKGIADVTDEDWELALQSNLSSTFLFCRGVVPKMRENKHGRIVNLNTLYYLGWPGKVNYSAATSGIFGLTRSLALELAKDNVTVNCVVKGDILTPDTDLSVEEVGKWAESLPVKRLGKPEDVSTAVAFFASDTSKYVTGQTLFVCGGKSLYFSMSA